MNHLARLFAGTIILTSVLTACGGGSDSTPTPTPTPTVNIGATAVKGIIKNGIVKIYGVTNGVIDTVALAEGTTDENGKYSLTVEDYTGPVVIEITSDATSVMVCDVISGCEGVGFGQDLILANDFSLKAVVAQIQDGEEVTTNVTSLTSLAAALAQGASTFDAPEIAKANSQVATLFNVTGDLTRFEVVDITNPDAVSAASSKAREVALLNSALLSAALKDAANGASIGSVLATVVANFVSNGGQMTNNESIDGANVTLAEIFSEVLAIVEDPSFAAVELGTLKSTTKLLLAKAELAVPDALTNAMPIDPADQDAAQSAKDMVEAVRAFGLSATYESSDEASLIESFEMATELVNDQDIDTIFDSLAPISKALVVAYEANMAAIEEGLDPLTTYSFFDESQFEIPVTITSSSAGDTYSIDMMVPDTVTETVALDVNIEATIFVEITGDLTESETATGYTEHEVFGGSGSLAISGAISSANVSMMIDSGDITLDLNGVYDGEESENSFEEAETIDITLASVDLNITLAQVSGDAPISFTGILGITLDSATVAWEYNEQTGADCDINNGPQGTEGCSSYTENEFNSIKLDEFDFMLSGTFTKDEESIQASITMNIDPDTSIHEQTENFMFSWVNFFQGDQFLDSVTNFEDVSNLTGETEENYIGVDLGIALEFNLAGATDATGIMLTATRTGLDTAIVSLDIAFDSDRLEIDFVVTGDDIEMTVTDQNGNTLRLTETCNVETDECTVAGNIMIDDVEVATIVEDTDNDAIVIMYQDGSFEVF